MSIYSGLPTREDQTNYNKLLCRLITTMQEHIIELTNGIIAAHFSSKYSKIIAKMETYEEHKYLPPKFTQILKPLENAIHNSYAVKARTQGKAQGIDFGFKLEAVREEEEFGSPHQISKHKTEAYIKKSMLKQKKLPYKQPLQTQTSPPNHTNIRSRSVFSEKKPKQESEYKHFEKIKARQTMGNLNYKRNTEVSSSSGSRSKIKSRELSMATNSMLAENQGRDLRKEMVQAANKGL